MNARDKALELLARKHQTHPVALVILPMLIQAQDDRERHERIEIKDLRAELDAQGWDSNKVAPYPSSARFDNYYIAKGKYDFLWALCKSVERPGVYDRNVRLVKMDDDLIVRYIKDKRTEAAYEFNAFVYKLCEKTGPTVLTAKMDADYSQEGYGLWRSSMLTVTKKGGITEKWKTQSILNRSKFGRLFRQFPSRIVK